MTISDVTANIAAKNRGGKRTGAGRPPGIGKYACPTKPLRVPIDMIEEIEEFIQGARSGSHMAHPGHYSSLREDSSSYDPGYSRAYITGHESGYGSDNLVVSDKALGDSGARARDSGAGRGNAESSGDGRIAAGVNGAGGNGAGGNETRDGVELVVGHGSKELGAHGRIAARGNGAGGNEPGGNERGDAQIWANTRADTIAPMPNGYETLDAAYNLPLYDSLVSAGFPSPADDNIDCRLNLNRYLIPMPISTFFVKVTGDSMIGAHINSGDILIVDKSIEARHNKIVIASVNSELTVKRLYKKHDCIKLVAENPDYPDIVINQEKDLVIWGVVTSVIHQCG